MLPGRVWGIIAVLGLPLALSACSGQPLWAAQSQATFAAASLLDPAGTCTTGHIATTAGFFVLLATGLLTGLSHCVGMCGPLVGAFTMQRRANRQEVSTPLVLFQMGRLTTYLLLGAISGATGYVLAAAIRDWQGILSIILGLFTALVGLNLLGLLPFRAAPAPTGLARAASKWMKQAMASNHPLAPFGLGLANGLLPCGPVYAMALLAATGGNPVRGAGIMLIFGLGTLPAMLGVGLSLSQLSLRVRHGLYRLAAVMVVIVGVQLALRGLALNGQVSHLAVGGIMLW